MKSRKKQLAEIKARDQKINKAAENVRDSLEKIIDTDPQGSYTGICTENPKEIPIQDVDDL